MLDCLFRSSWVHPFNFSGVRVTRSLVSCVFFLVWFFFSFCTFSFGHCVVCPSSSYGIWLPLWYLQNLLIQIRHPNFLLGFVLFNVFSQVFCVFLSFSRHCVIWLSSNYTSFDFPFVFFKLFLYCFPTADSLRLVFYIYIHLFKKNTKIVFIEHVYIF
jgi:hypothetical protein